MASRTTRARLAIIAFALMGALAGYALHRLVGCPGGGCPITGSPLASTAYGLVVGAVVGSGSVGPSRRP